MKKYKCPECGNLSDEVPCTITGTAWMDIDRNVTLDDWGLDVLYCEDCNFQESTWEKDKFEIIEVESDKLEEITEEDMTRAYIDAFEGRIENIDIRIRACFTEINALKAEKDNCLESVKCYYEN